MSEGFDLEALLNSATQMQEQLLAAQAAAAEAVVEGRSGGGVVSVRLNGAFEFESVSIAPEAVDPDDVTMLEDLVLAALHDAVAKLASAQEQMAGAGGPGGMDLANLDLGGLDLGGLLGGVGGGASDVEAIEEVTEADRAAADDSDEPVDPDDR
jgi:nucleoid-associated protein EbfC